MELLATHVGADFDALASVLVARRLHPEAELFFPGSRQASVRRFLATGLVEFAELKQRQIEPGAIRRLILCDVRQRDRIGILGAWLAARPDIEVWCYDHHTDGDLPVAGGRVDPSVGSTSTLLAEELANRALSPSPTEATLLLLGIYEDTGALTYATTSARDLEAAARLLRAGGDLALVRRFASAALDPERLDILHRIARSLEVHRIHGHRVGIAEVDLGTYVEELAPLVSRSLDLFGLPLLFVLFSMAERVHLIARGDAPGVDLGRVVAAIAATARESGGGHATAASGRLAGTLVEAREHLLAELPRHLPPAARARDLMVPARINLEPGATIAQAKERLIVGGVNAAPVLDDGGRAVGAVSRQALDAALQHGLGERPVDSAMTRDLTWVAPEAPAEELSRRMLERQPRFVLVGDPLDARPLGLVTRMQLLRFLGARLDLEDDPKADPLARFAGSRKEGRREAAELIAARVEPALAARIECIAAVARATGTAVYLVGGFVRDLLLDRENRDLDLVVEGDGPRFARDLAVEFGAEVRVHDAFLTAQVHGEDAAGRFEIDVATARSEFYRSPAALPEVASSMLRQDLYRRDFTINTMALRLGPDPTMELLDCFGGRGDLEARRLRVLHSLSFLDDPTRALRAARLELRLGFRLAPESEGLIDVALAEGAFDRLSGSRLRAELWLLLGDEAIALPGIERLAELAVLAALDPRLAPERALAPAVRERLRAALAAYDWFRLQGFAEPAVELATLLLLALAADLPTEARERLGERLLAPRALRESLVRLTERLAAAHRALAVADARPSEISAALADLTGEELLLLVAEAPEAERAEIRRDLEAVRRIVPTLRGGDLIAAGVTPGPAVGEALRAVRAALQDGALAPGRDGELAFAVAIARRERAAVG